jgi:hypothetical protein
LEKDGRISGQGPNSKYQCHSRIHQEWIFLRIFWNQVYHIRNACFPGIKYITLGMLVFQLLWTIFLNILISAGICMKRQKTIICICQSLILVHHWQMMQSWLLKHGDGAQTHASASARMPCCIQHMTTKNANYMQTIYNGAFKSHHGNGVVSATVQLTQYCIAHIHHTSGTVTQQNAHYMHTHCSYKVRPKSFQRTVIKHR